MSRQIPLIGHVGDIKLDGGYDVTVKTADGIIVGKYEMDSDGKPIVKDYVESNTGKNKVYITDNDGKNAVKPLSDFAMAGDIPTVPGYQAIRFYYQDSGDGLYTYLMGTYFFKVGDTVSIQFCGGDYNLTIIGGDTTEFAAIGLGVGTGDDSTKIVGTVIAAEVPLTLAIQLAAESAH